MASPAAILQVFVNANTKVASAQLAAFDRQLASVGKTSAATSVSMGKMTKGATVAGAGIAAIGVASIVAGKQLYDLAKQFDSAYDTIRVRTGATGRELERLKGNFKDVARNVPNDFEDVGKAIGDLNVRLGLTGKPLKRMAENMLHLSNITGDDLEGNIKAVARAFVDWEVTVPKQTNYLNGMFRVSQASGASIAQLAEEVQKFGSPLRQLGFNFEEAVSMFASFERAGVNTQTMVPGLKLALSNLTMPTEDLAKKMAQLGIEAGKPDTALRKVFALLGDQSNLSKANKITLAMQVFGKRAGADMKEAISQGRFEVDKFLKLFRDNKGDTIGKAANETYDFAENIKILGNNFKVLLEPAANKVFVALDKIARGLVAAFREAETAEDVFRIFVEQAFAGMGKLVQKAVELAPKVALAFVNGFVQANVWGKLAVGALLLRAMGGLAAIVKIGAFIGVQAGTSMAAGIAAGMSGGSAVGAAAAAGGLAGRIGAVLKNIKWARVGLVGAGIMAADMFMGAMAKRMQAQSADLQTAMKAVIEPSPDLLGINLNPLLNELTATFGEGAQREVALWIQTAAEAAQRGSAELSAAREAEIRSGMQILDLTAAQKKAVNDLFALYRAGRELGIGINADMDVEQLNTISDGLRLLRSNALTSLADVNRVMDRTGNTIRENFGPKTAEGRKLLADNMRAAAEAIKAGMKSGAISTKAGTARIKKLLKDARLIDPTRKEAHQLGQVWGNGFKNMGRVTSSGVARVISQAKRMPPAMRKIAINTMLSQIDAAKKAGDISEKEYRKLRSRVISEFQGMKLGVKKATDGVPRETKNSTERTKKQFDSVADSAERSSRRIKASVKGIPGPVRGAYTRLASYANSAAEAFGSNQRVSLAFRRGGMAKFSGPGLVPAMVSPGELISYKGREVYVPGRPEPRDSVMMNLPAGAKVFTFDGQARMAMGASQNEALRKQAPHFATGGVVTKAPRPRLVGGSRVPRATGQSAIDRARDQAEDWVAKLKPTLDMITRIARGFGLSMTSGYRPGDDGYHGIDRARDYSNSSGPTPEMFKFGTYMADNYQKHLLELIYTPLGFGIKNGARTAPYAADDHYDHVHVAMRKGGVIPKLIQRFRGGGFVGNINKVYPGIQAPDWSGYKLPGYVIAALAQAAGMPGRTMEQMTRGESLGRPGSWGHDANGYSTGYGLWAITDPYANDLAAKVGGYKNFLNPVLNAWAANVIYRRQGLRAWYGDQYVTGGNLDYTGKYDIRKALGGYGYQGALYMASKGRLGEKPKGKAKFGPDKGKDKAEKARETAKKKAKQRRIARKIARMAAKGLQFPGQTKLAEFEAGAEKLVEQIDLYDREATADWSPAGSDYDQTELSSLIAYYTDLLNNYIEQRNIVIAAVKVLQGRIAFWEAKIQATENPGAVMVKNGEIIKPGKKWQIKGWQKAIANARSTIGSLGEKRLALEGLTGDGGAIGDTRFTLKELGATTSPTDTGAADSEIADLLRQQLQETQRALAISQAQMPIFQQFMPRFHQGGIVQGPNGAERPVMAQAGEGIFTRDQMRAMGSQNITVVIEDAAIDSNRIRVEVDGVIQDKVSTVRRQGSNRRFTTSR